MTPDDLERMYSFVASHPEGVSESDIARRGFHDYTRLIAELEDAHRMRHTSELYRGVIFYAICRRGR